MKRLPRQGILINTMTNILNNPLIISIIILAVAVIILLFFVISMHRRLKSFLVDVDARNIAESFTYVSNDLNDLKKFRTELETYLTDVEKRLRKSIQSVHTVRFNPFVGTGGGSNQSFATTLINEDGDGVIISSLYSREHVSVFAKPIKKHTTEHELSDEETVSLESARKGLEK